MAHLATDYALVVDDYHSVDARDYFLAARLIKDIAETDWDRAREQPVVEMVRKIARWMHKR